MRDTTQGAMGMPGRERYAFGPFRLEADQHRLWRDGAEVELPPKAMDTLLLLVRRAGDLVGRDEFFATLWPDTVVTEASLGRHIWLVRRALGQGDVEYIQTVPKKGYRFIEPVSRIVRPEAAAPAVGAAAVPAGGASDSSPRTTAAVAGAAQPGALVWRRTGLAVVVSVAMLLATAAWLPFQSWRTGESAGVRATIKRPASVALFDLLAEAPAADAGLRSALTELLRYELSLDEQLRIVSGQPLAKLTSLAPGGRPEPALLNRLHRQLGIALAIVGRYRGGPDEPVRLDLQVIDTATGRTLQTVTVEGDRRNASGLVVAAGDRLRERLDLGPLSSSLQDTRRATLPRDAQTLQSYSEGVYALRRGDGNEARRHLAAAAEREPGFLPAQLALVGVLASRGYAAEASARARESLGRASGAPRELRLALEATMHEANRDWPRATTVYRELYLLYPGDVAYGFSLAQMLVADGKVDEALSILGELRQRRGADPLIENLAAGIALQQGDAVAARVSADAAIRSAKELQAPLLEASSLVRRGVARGLQDDRAGALADYEQARRIFVSQHDAQGEGQVTVSLGIHYARQGDFDRARRLLEEALEIFERTGDKGGIAPILLNLASIEIRQGRSQSARHRLEVVLQLGRELSNLELQAAALTGLAIAQFDAGETGAALATYHAALDIARRGSMDVREASILDALAYVHSLRGEYAVAVDLAKQVLALSRERRNPGDEARFLARLGQIHMDSGALADARKSLQAALAIHRKAGRLQEAASLELDLAALALDEGDPERSLDLLARCVPVFQSNAVQDSVAFAHAVRADALLRLGRPPAHARESLALALQHDPEDALARVPIQLVEARLLAAEGNHPAARQRLDAATRLARSRQLDGVVEQIKRAAKGSDPRLAKVD